MNYEQLLEAAGELEAESLHDAILTKPEDLGLDRRVAHRLLVDPERSFIAVPLAERRTLDYYGGFEYIEPEYIMIIGDHVFYSGESDRVNSALANLPGEGGDGDEDICPTCNGSGEGQVDGSICGTCHGSGVHKSSGAFGPSVENDYDQ